MVSEDPKKQNNAGEAAGAPTDDVSSDAGEAAGAPTASAWIIVGAGRVGRTLGLAANRLGIDIRATWNRSRESMCESRDLLEPEQATCGELPEAMESVDFDGAVVWVTVVDDVLLDVGRTIAETVSEAALVLHACGSLEAEKLRETGIEAPVGGLHPLLAVTDPQKAVERLGECVWTVDGDREAVEFGQKWAGAFDAQLIEIEAGARAGYHASAVTAANLVVALFDAALEMAGEAGIERSQARRMLLPLLRSSVDNLTDQSTGEALSGPSARGDTETIERHRQMLAEVDADLLELYEVLTERALELGEDAEE